MGCPYTFEYRRQELSRENKPHTDEDVAMSFLESVSPDGFMTNYIKHGVLSVAFGDCLFVHGGLKDQVVGWVPDIVADNTQTSSVDVTSKASEIGGKTYDDLETWLTELDKFKAVEIDKFVNHSLELFGEAEDGATNESKEGQAQERDERCWSEVGGYNHPEPGSALMQYGKRYVILMVVFISL
jgi:hypothetical protein